MASISSTPPTSIPSAYSAKGICQIVGLACLAGFAIDMLVISLPPAVGNVEWRAALMQQMSDRSIIVLIGAALLLFGSIDHRRWVKRFCTGCLILGVLFCMSSILVIADTLALHQKTIAQISAQEAQIKTQINSAQANPSALGQNVTPETLTAAAQQLGAQATTLKQNAKTNVVKLGASSVGNLVVVGLGLISIGRLGMRLRTR
jgi:predicted PurR-regulated permease PerM